jgi:hypothetical protein
MSGQPNRKPMFPRVMHQWICLETSQQGMCKTIP